MVDKKSSKAWHICGQDRKTGLCSCLQIWDEEMDVCIAIVQSTKNCDRHFEEDVILSVEKAEEVARLIASAPILASQLEVALEALGDCTCEKVEPRLCGLCKALAEITRIKEEKDE